MKSIVKFFIGGILLFGVTLSCGKKAELEARLDNLDGRISSLEALVASSNENAIAVGKFLRGDDILIVGYRSVDYGYELELSDGTVVTVTFGTQASSIVPVLGVNQDGEWIISLDGGKTFEKIVGAHDASGEDGYTPRLRVDENGCWILSVDGGSSWEVLLDGAGKPMSATAEGASSAVASFFRNVVFDQENSCVLFTLQDDRIISVPLLESFYLNVIGYQDGASIRLNETLLYEVEISGVADAVIRAPEDWKVALSDTKLSVIAPSEGVNGSAYQTEILLVSVKGYLKRVTLRFVLDTVTPDTGKTGVKTWDDFYEGNEDNILPDFSYAGFDHGESVPSDALSLGWTVYDVTNYGAVPNDGLSDRAAVLQAYQAAIGNGAVQNPVAKAVLYFPEGEFILHTSADNADGKSSPLQFRAGYFAVKGAGRDKTTLVMQDPNLPTSEALYSSPVMMEIKHYTDMSDLTSVTADAPVGAFSVSVASVSGISAGDWVCLYLLNNDATLVAQELAPMTVLPAMTNLTQNGVQIIDYHRVASVKGNVLTFEEPLLHAVEAKWNWKIREYPHYEMVGVEDLTFKGNAKADFIHHGSWQDDGGYKPLTMSRIVNGWIRRVRFTSVSEACSIASSANVSVYDVEIDGNRGHAAVRSQSSSRVFLGKIKDHSGNNAGQFHATGVAKPSLGTVLWRNIWGLDACFESHCTQPRTTLIDCCNGGWKQDRGGGAESEQPNHLKGLVIWNFQSQTAFEGVWDWWRSGTGWKYLPPIVVGFHGEACQFDESQTLVDEFHGVAVNPESLYEAQLKKRLGAVPAWLNTIKQH